MEYRPYPIVINNYQPLVYENELKFYAAKVCLFDAYKIFISYFNKYAQTENAVDIHRGISLFENRKKILILCMRDFGRFKARHIIDFYRTFLTMFKLVSNLSILTLDGSFEALTGSCCLGGVFLRAPSVEDLGGPGFCSTSPHSIKMAAKQITSLNPDFNPVVKCTWITFTRVLHLFG